MLALSFGCARKEPNVVRIGVIAPLTGEAAIYGDPLRKGLELAKEEINSKGGVQGQKLLLIYEDSQADPKTAVSAFNKLVVVDKVSLIIGDMFSSTTLPIAQLAQKNKIVLLSPTVSSEEVPKIGEFIFSIYPSSSYDGKFVATFALSQIQKKTAAVVFVQADAMLAVKDAFIESFIDLGGEVLLEQSYAPKTDDFRSILARIRSARPEVIFIPGYIEEIVKILKQAKELGVKGQFITISTAYDEKLFSLAGNSAEGLLLSAPFFDEASQEPEIVAFQKSFKMKYGEAPDVWAAYGYDALEIISEAYIRSLTDSTQLNEELGQIKNYPGVTGKTTFLRSGHVEKQLRVLVVRNNDFVEYK